MVNSARAGVNNLEEANETARSSFLDPNPSIVVKGWDTTGESGREMQDSLLWKARASSESKDIRVSNRDAMNKELLDRKLGLCQ